MIGGIVPPGVTVAPAVGVLAGFVAVTPGNVGAGVFVLAGVKVFVGVALPRACVPVTDSVDVFRGVGETVAPAGVGVIWATGVTTSPSGQVISFPSAIGAMSNAA